MGGVIALLMTYCLMRPKRSTCWFWYLFMVNSFCQRNELPGAGGLVLIRVAECFRPRTKVFWLKSRSRHWAVRGSNPKQVIHDADYPTGWNRHSVAGPKEKN